MGAWQQMMTSGDIRAFRAQLSLPAQVELFDYWLSLCEGPDIPRRAAFSPGGIPGLLPHVSLLEARPEPQVFRVRLAGTALRDLHGREITSETLQSPGWDGSRDYWLRIMRMIQETRQPAAGMLRAIDSGKDHLVQFWLRLPLRGPDPQQDMILGLDVCQTVSTLDGGLLGKADHLAATSGC